MVSMRLCSCFFTTVLEKCRANCVKFEKLNLRDALEYKPFFKRFKVQFLEHHLHFLVDSKIMLIDHPKTLWQRTKDLFKDAAFAKEFSQLVIDEHDG